MPEMAGAADDLGAVLTDALRKRLLTETVSFIITIICHPQYVVVLDLDLDPTLIEGNALGHTSMPFSSVIGLIIFIRHNMVESNNI